MNYRRLSGIFFIAFPILVQVPFNVLVAKFGYRDVLRESPSTILASFLQGGSFLIGVWYAYALSILVFVAGILAYDRSDKTTSLINRVGLASAAIQFVALLRWTFLVPFLARDYAGATETATRQSIETLFTIQHNFLGVGLGEHVGQLTMAIWTVLIIRHTQKNIGLQILGYLSAALLTVGLSEHLAVVFGFNAGILAQGAMIGFILWSVWLIGFGVTLVRELPLERVEAGSKTGNVGAE